MRSDSRLAMARYVEAARQHYDSHPEDEQRLHQEHMESLGLSHSAMLHLRDNGLAGVAAHLHANTSERMRIAALETPQKQIPELQKIQARQAAGQSGEEDDNEKTREYLRTNSPSMDRLRDKRRSLHR